MAEVREQRQRDRAEARAGRRTNADESASVDLKRAATAALTAAVAGALAGAAKAAVDKRGGGAHDKDEVEEAEQDRTPAPEDEAESPDEPDEDDDSEAEEEPAPQPQQQDGSAQTGAPSSDVASMIARAKEHVEAVLGSEAESVSGIERANGNWRVNVEVVQLRRVPESTDVLASYAVVLDGDGDLISVQEVRRYTRSQAEDR